MKTGAFVVLVFLSIAGCTGESTANEHSISSLSVESKEHIFSNQYHVFVKLKSGMYDAQNRLVLYENAIKLDSRPLNLTASEEKNDFSFLWKPHSTGEYELRAVIETANGTEVSNSKTLQILVEPFGKYDLKNFESSRPVETEVWCAEQFVLKQNVSISSLELNLRSMVPTRAEKIVVAGIYPDEAGVPGTVPLVSSFLFSSEVPSNAKWIDFPVEYSDVPAGKYWLLLKRNDTVGNLAWTYEPNAKGSAVCRDTSVSEQWVPIGGSFAFKIK